MSKHQDNRLYFIRRQDGRVKIGFSRTVVSRARTIARGIGALEVLGIMPGGIAEEKDLHKRFEADRVEGEWYEPSEDLLALIASKATPLHARVEPLPLTIATRESAAYLAEMAARPRPASCAHCGKSFTARGRGKYCSPSCRTLAWAKANRPSTGRPRGRPRKISPAEVENQS